MPGGFIQPPDMEQVLDGVEKMTSIAKVSYITINYYF